MNFQQALSAVWHNYAKFNGRARRAEYWYFRLFQALVWLAGCILAGILVAVGRAFEASDSGDSSFSAGLFYIPAGIIGIILIAFAIGCIIPNLAVGWRRFQDQNIRGWLVIVFFVLGLIPYVNFISSIVEIIFMCQRGTNGSNQYGSDPLSGENGNDAGRAMPWETRA